MTDDQVKPGILFEQDDPLKRIHSVGTRLNTEENAELETLATARHVTSGELLRTLVKEEVQRVSEAGKVTPELAEIVGVRLLLMNLLRPLVTGKTLTVEDMEKISRNVKAMKKTAAAEILSGERD